jgi:hypothetical protein
MSLRQQAKILEVHHSILSKCINGQKAWNSELKERYENLVAIIQVNLSVTAGHLE